MHPSWRDLVIAELADDSAARRRFLERSGLNGVLLALSVAGGATGERLLPLLLDDRDWDTLTARVGDLAPELDSASAIRLLAALEAALNADLPERTRIEAEALATFALERLTALWDSSKHTLPVAALEAWLATASRLSNPPPVPPVAPLWIELLPTQLVHLRSQDELVRFDEWLALADVLRLFAPQELEHFQFPERHHDVLARFVAASAMCPDDTEELVTQILRRIRRVAPAYAPDAAEAAHALAAKEEPWFEVRFETHPQRSEPALADLILVERVLRDLA